MFFCPYQCMYHVCVHVMHHELKLNLHVSINYIMETMITEIENKQIS